MAELRDRIRAAWQGRISGCQLGKAVEILSVSQGATAVVEYLEKADALPLRDYIPALPLYLPMRGLVPRHYWRRGWNC
jgi:hypothetical protein